MTVKFIGLLLICISFSVYGLKLSEEIKETHQAKKEILMLITAIERGIQYGNSPLNKTLKNFTAPILEKSGFLQILRQRQNITQKACEKAKLSDSKDVAIICDFFSNLGKSTYSEKELILCKECIDYFKNSAADAEAAVKTKSALYKKLGILTGIASIIILI